MSTNFNKNSQHKISRNSVLWEPNYASRTGLTKLIVAFRICLLNPHQKSVVPRRVAASLHHSRVCAQGQQFSDFFLKRVLSKHGHSPISKRKDQNVVQSTQNYKLKREITLPAHNLRINRDSAGSCAAIAQSVQWLGCGLDGSAFDSWQCRPVLVPAQSPFQRYWGSVGDSKAAGA